MATDSESNFLDIKAIIEKSKDNFRLWVVVDKNSDDSLQIKEVYSIQDPVDYEITLYKSTYNEVKNDVDLEFFFDEKEKLTLILKYANK